MVNSPSVQTAELGHLCQAIGHLEVVPGSMLPSGGEGTRPQEMREMGEAHLGFEQQMVDDGG